MGYEILSSGIRILTWALYVKSLTKRPAPSAVVPRITGSGDTPLLLGIDSHIAKCLRAKSWGQISRAQFLPLPPIVSEVILPFCGPQFLHLYHGDDKRINCACLIWGPNENQYIESTYTYACHIINSQLNFIFIISLFKCLKSFTLLSHLAS